jgi:ComF family protein
MVFLRRRHDIPGTAIGPITGSAIIRRAFPDCCVFCGSETPGGLCINCRWDLPRVPDPCGRCHQPVGVPCPPGLDCAACQVRPPPFYRARSALLYAFPVDAALKSFKFGHTLYYVPVFAQLLFAEFLQNFEDADALVPVPLHHWRYATRGFNQAAELCKPLSRLTELPVLRSIRRVRPTRPQSGLDAAARRRNLRDAFAAPAKLACSHPLIIDDVMTTGETCRQLARVLLDAGAAKVGVLTVARAAGYNAT